MNHTARSLHAALFCLLAAALPIVAAPKDDLLAAAREGDSAKLAAALDAGADPNSADADGFTALMLAARSGSFTACRELLWAGAKAATTNKEGQTVLDCVAEDAADGVALRVLLRCYTYVQANASPAATRPKRPTLVMIMEDTVNYLHPKLKPLYYVNKAEASGQPGRDDDNNGFVDDVYGWVPVTDRPYQIRAAQFDTYLKHRETIGRIIQVDTDRVAGRISREEAAARLEEFTNPLSEIMGPMQGLSDGDFLNMVKDAAHGSHVAGIVSEASEGKAQLHTLGLNFHEESRRFLGRDTDRIVREIRERAADPDTLLGELRARVLEHNTARGRVASRYLQSVGAGIANLSFGGGMGWWKGVAGEQLSRFVEFRQKSDPDFAIDEDTGNALVEKWGFELYVANAAELATLFYENPDVLFVCSAGNDDTNNDEALIYPAYLARLLPNVITVASADSDGLISGFSNFGKLSVSIAAPGEDILSTVIPEASIYMNGTSMAAPCVSGVAALARALSPTLTAAELRRLLEATVAGNDNLPLYTTSGGNIDRETLRGYLTGDARARSSAFARLAVNNARFDAAVFPRQARDADRFSQKATELDGTNPLAWHARASYLASTGESKRALEAVDKALKLDARLEPAWHTRALVLSDLDNVADAIVAVTRCIDLLDGDAAMTARLRARRLVLRAILHFRADQLDECKRDALAAREISPRIGLPEPVEALLPASED
jgi:tetratricopeptide (TPR) repeat protein